MNRLILLSLTILLILGNSLFSQSLQTEKWLEDLDYLVRHFPANDRSLAPTQAYIFDEEGVQLPYFQIEQKLDRFFEMADQLREEIPKLDDHQVIVRMAALVGMSNNAHSRIYLLRNRTALSSLAIRTYWFEGGLYVIRGLPETRKALGCKIIGINGIPLEDIIDKVDALYGGNGSWKKYKRIYYLNSPEILKGLGIITDVRKVKMTLQPLEGASFEMDIPALPLIKSKVPREVNLDLSPLHQSDGRDWLTILPKEKLPLFLQHPDKAYWYEFLEKKDMLFFQHNRIQNDEEQSFEEFAEAMIGELQAHKPGKLVIDLRFNTGGDLTITLPYWKKLADALPNETQVYVLTSYSTFSAAISNVVQYRRMMKAKIIGEPVGDYLTNWSEGGRFYLPNSGLEIKYANGFHDMTFFPKPDLMKLLTDDEFMSRYEQKLTQPQVLGLDEEISFRFEDFKKGIDGLLMHVMEK